MKKSIKACTLAITLALLLSACGNHGANTTAPPEIPPEVVTERAAAVTTVGETEETEYFVEAKLNSGIETIVLSRIDEHTDIPIEEQLYLAQRAVDLLIDLKNDYDNTVGQIRFEPNDNLGEDFPYEESVKAIFNNERVITAMGLFGYINVYNSFCCCEKSFNVVIGVVFSDIEKMLFWGISFTKENEEWIINSVYPSI